jgi:large exoprotein involved in heme utilization and adhesion
LGRLSANGQVYLINPNGILFGKGAQVNVGGLVASTLGFNDASLGANARVFSGNSLASLVNLGAITTAEGGFVALLGNTVSNQGTINAPRGKVMLGGASAATLGFANNALVSMKIDQSVFNTLVENGGLIKADGGTVALTAGAQTSKAPGVVRQTGYIQARTLNNQNGIITLLSGMAAGTVYVDGTLDASAPAGGNGGFIETSAAKVRIGNDVKVSTAAAKGFSGKWLIDPTDFTISLIDPGNGDGFMSSTTLATNLKTGDVVIQTSAAGSGNGDINVNDTVSWAANKLTLTAAGNININASLKGSGKASLAFEYGQGADPAGNTSTYVINAAVDLPTGLNFSTVMGKGGVLKTYTVINDLGKASDATIATMPLITTLQSLAAAPNLRMV